MYCAFSSCGLTAVLIYYGLLTKLGSDNCAICKLRKPEYRSRKRPIEDVFGSTPLAVTPIVRGPTLSVFEWYNAQYFGIMR